MDFLIVTIPVSFLVAVCLLVLVIRAVRSGAFDDWDGPAQRMLLDDDRDPEIESTCPLEATSAPPVATHRDASD